MLSHFTDKNTETLRVKSSELSHRETKLELEARLASLREQHWFSLGWQESSSGEESGGRGL